MSVRILICLLLLGCAKRPTGQITLALNWFPEAEHGGYYAALVHGFYKDAGLDVKILAGGPDVPVVSRVATGAATFGVDNADAVLFGRAEGAPVVSVMAPIRDSPRCIMVHEESGITNFAGLQNLTLAMSAKGAFSHFIRKHVPLAGVEIVPYPGSISRFLVDRNYAQQGYVFSEPFLARKEGARPRALMLSDLGFNPYTSVLIATEQTLNESPDVVARFVRASVLGWRKYLANPRDTNNRIHDLNPEMSLDVLTFGVGALRPLAESKISGRMTQDRWLVLHDQLVELGLIKSNAVVVEHAFTTRFLEP